MNDPKSIRQQVEADASEDLELDGGEAAKVGGGGGGKTKSGAGAGKVTVHDIQITKWVDASSPSL